MNDINLNNCNLTNTQDIIKAKNEIKRIGDYLIATLKRKGIVIQYFIAKSGSYYIKLDYGVLNSIRISNHGGKKYLHYKYNVGLNVKKYSHIIDKKIDRYYYPSNCLETLIQDILNCKKEKISTYTLENYNKYMEENKKNNNGNIGFWRKCKEA